MRTQIGQLFFVFGTLVAIALAAKTPDWEAAQESAASVVAQMGKEPVSLRTELGSAVSPQKSDAIRTLFTQALTMEGVEVREDAPRTLVMRNKTGSEDGPLQLVWTTAGAEQATTTVELDFKRSWPATTMPWMIFAVLATVGVLLWRSGTKQNAQAQDASLDDATQNPFVLLERLIPAAQQHVAEVATLDCEGLRKRADALLEEYLLPMAEVRQRVIDRVGMKLGSEILVSIAYGERILNRVWSAAADGHLPEAQACFPEAVDALVEAHRLAQAALESSST